MWSDGQSRSEIPANLVVYVLKIVKIKKLCLKMITPGNSRHFKAAPKKVMFDEMSLLLSVCFDKYFC